MALLDVSSESYLFVLSSDFHILGASELSDSKTMRTPHQKLMFACFIPAALAILSPATSK
jgi:hypothetical protein